MLGALRKSRELTPTGASATSNGDWQSYCREEGRRAAMEFLSRLKEYRESHPDVPESSCIREFASSLTEVLGSLGSSNTHAEPGRNASPPKPSKSGKQWWKIFKRSKSVRHKESRRKDMCIDDNPGVILDRVVSQMNLNETECFSKWEHCRLVLINRHGNYQLEIYTPPKSIVPKMSLFCFLIEDVRSATLLEVPDSDSSFVIKSRSHGEYVFNTDSSNDKEIWINTISQYKSHHIPMSTSLGTLSDHTSRPNGRPITRISRSRSQTPVNRLTSPPPPQGNSALDHALSNSVKLRDTPASSGRRLVRSMCLDTPSLSSSPPFLETNRFSSQAEKTVDPNTLSKKSSSENESSLSSTTINPISLVGIDVSMETTPPSIPPVTRKCSAPDVVQHGLQVEGAEPRFRSSETLNQTDEERMSFITVPLSANDRGHARHRSYDSSYSHGTEPTSPLARNCYRIDVGSSERIGSVTSGRSSTFSSAGNLHDVTRDQTNSPGTLSTTPDHLMRLETASQLSNPLYIETNGTTQSEIQFPSHSTVGAYQSWANTSSDVENLRNLSQYPWFHGLISRATATHLVLAGGNSGCGQYLVRQSESREGDFVLTFNCNGRAKHLRFTLDTSTGCFIQHLWFEDSHTMIEYFKSHPIPLDSMPATDDTVLTTHVDRSASDGVRTTTVINMERIQRTPPRRSRSVHISSSLAATLGDGSNSPVHGNRPNSRQSNWRQIFSRPTSSSSPSVRSHATVQRTHSANAGSLQEIAMRSRNRWSNRVSENNYVSRQY